MKRSPGKVTVGALVVAGLAVATVGLPSASASNYQGQMRNPVGTWVLTVTPDNPAIPAFEGIDSFTLGGVVTATANKPGSGPGYGTTGLGVWQMYGPALHMRWQSFNFDGTGAFVSTATIVETDTFSGDGNSLTGHGEATITAPNGTVLFQFSATDVGVRMALSS